MLQVSFELSIFSGRFGSDFYSCIYINDLWTSQSSNRPFSNCAVSSLSIQNQSVINEDYSDGDGVYNGVENTNIERSRHHSRYSSTLWKILSGSFKTRIIYCNIVFVTSLETFLLNSPLREGIGERWRRSSEISAILYFKCNILASTASSNWR